MQRIGAKTKNADLAPEFGDPASLCDVGGWVGAGRKTLTRCFPYRGKNVEPVTVSACGERTHTPAERGRAARAPELEHSSVFLERGVRTSPLISYRVRRTKR